MAASSSYCAAAQHHDDDNNDIAVDKTSWQFIPLDTYLENVMNAVDPSFRMPVVTEQHRKKMIRCLMGYSHHHNSTFDVQIQTLNAQVQWEKSSAFFSQHVVLLNPSPVDVPHFDEGIRQWQQLQHDNRNHNYLASAKFYSSLVRGRTYKGQFELLLQDVAPHLVDTYQEIVSERSDLELMKLFISKEQEKHWTSRDGITKAKCDESDHNQHSHHNKEDNVDDVNPAVIWKDQLLELLEKDFGDNKGADQPADGGKEMGIQGEMDLVSFLQERFGSAKRNHQTNANSNANTNINPRTMVLSNVLVKPHSKHRHQLNQLNNPRKRTIPHVILSDANPAGMTSEFDAMVVEKVLDTNNSSIVDSIRIVELWEAKNSLHLISISDCITKKMPAMQTVLDDPEARICFYHPRDNPEVCDLLCSGDDNSSLLAPEASFLSFPLFSSANKGKDNNNNDHDTTIKLGIFGNSLLSPEVSARRIQCIHCEALLEKSPKAVLEALKTGSVPVPNVRPHLQDILEEARRLQPIVVVPVSTNKFC